MYLEHFGLERQPFKITPDTSLFYEGSKRGAALEALMYAIRSGEGIIKVVGEVGSGKTMLCRMLEVRLADSIDVVYIANPSLSPDNILHVIAHELHLDISSDESKLSVMQKLQDYLLKKHANNRQIVLFVEEAQSMPVETLEEIRLLSNLETDQHKLLQMVLFGQPELDEKLSQPQIRQLKERITHSFYLDPFPPKDTLDYLNFRLRAVGYKGPSLFSQRTANAVEKYSGGLSRRINIIADKALMASFSEGGHEVSSKHVATAAKDSDFRTAKNMRPWVIGAGGVILLVIAVWLGTLLPLEGNKSPVLADTASHMEAQKGVAANTAQDTNAQMADVSAGPESRISPTRLDQRLSETEKWLRQADSGNYSIQLFMTRIADAKAVESFLKNRSDVLEFEKIYVYETKIGGSRMYSVLYNDYETLTAARTMLQNLPDSLQASKPYLRRVSALKKDIIAAG
jgi:type II secretory pathway predicted ATPase ExeA